MHFLFSSYFPPFFLAAFQAVALAVHLKDMAIVGDPGDKIALELLVKTTVFFHLHNSFPWLMALLLGGPPDLSAKQSRY